MAKKPQRRKCRNPLCLDYFETTDDRKLYCNQKCKQEANNYKNAHLQKTDLVKEKIIRKNYGVLKKLFNDQRYISSVPEIILRHENLDFQVFTDKSENLVTKSPIWWNHKFGLELIRDTPSKVYKIHKR